MASKQLGKFRQWAGEVISSRDKTATPEEFHELQHDVELRRSGIRRQVERFCPVCTLTDECLTKKKDCGALDEPGKLLPIDALGIVMIIHGEEFREDSAFGSHLVKLGRAHCKVATLQEAYALTFQAGLISSINKWMDDIKDYDTQRKKLDSRRLSLDTTITKVEKLKKSKKEKDQKEAEEELEKAKARYEETSEDIRASMRSIQDNEVNQMHELTKFLDLEINFVQQYLEVLKDTKSDWEDESHPQRFYSPLKPRSSITFPKVTEDMAESSPSSEYPVTPGHFRNYSDSSGDDNKPGSSSSRKSTILRKKSNGSFKARSRSTSRASRKRSNSLALASDDKEKPDKGGRHLSVTSWATSAVESVTGRAKKHKDKDTFTALKDNQTEDGNNVTKGELHRSNSLQSSSSRKSSRRKSKESLTGTSSKAPSRILKPHSLEDKKIVRAVDDFNGSADELSFKTGDEIVVLSEVIDGWWMGELEGRKGLFPTSATEVVAMVPSRLLPSHFSRTISARSSESDDSMKRPVAAPEADTGSELEDDYSMTAQHLSMEASPFYGYADDAGSTTEDDDGQRLFPEQRTSEDQWTPLETQTFLQPPDHQHPQMQRTAGVVDPGTLTSGKRAPPPPPPRRTTSGLQAPSPPIPPRRPISLHTPSSASSSISALAASINRDTSPFESPKDFSE